MNKTQQTNWNAHIDQAFATIQTSRRAIDEIMAKEGYKAAKAAADKAGILWFASAGAKRKREE